MSAYMLRRTQEVLSKHLPPLAVHTMFCRPTPLQASTWPLLLTQLHHPVTLFAILHNISVHAHLQLLLACMSGFYMVGV